MAKITTITNPLTGQPAQVDQLDHTAQEIDDAIARALPGGAIDIALQNKRYYMVTGLIANSDECDVEGIGQATVCIQTNDIARIDFALKITVNSTSVSSSKWGINPSLLTAINANIPKIKPYSGGWLLMLDENGGYRSQNGYGAYMSDVSGKWSPCRVYNDNGATGPWGASSFPVGSKLIGTCYGYI